MRDELAGMLLAALLGGSVLALWYDAPCLNVSAYASELAADEPPSAWSKGKQALEKLCKQPSQCWLAQNQEQERQQVRKLQQLRQRMLTDAFWPHRGYFGEYEAEQAIVSYIPGCITIEEIQAQCRHTETRKFASMEDCERAGVLSYGEILGYYCQAKSRGFYVPAP